MTQSVLPTYIAGVGARTHVGLDALQVTLASRAEKLRPRECHMVDKRGETIATCRLPNIADNLFGVERYVPLLRAPLLQAARPWFESFSPEPPPALSLSIVLPEAHWPGVDDPSLRRFGQTLVEQSAVPLDASHLSLTRGGRAGGVRALDAVDAAFARGERAVLLAGVDTYFDPDVLELLDRDCRLHGLETENGVIPGEGAGALLLTRSATVAPPIALLLARDAQFEPHPWGSDEPCHAVGMSLAMKNCCKASVGAESAAIDWAITDVANERHRVNEWQLALGRMFRAFQRDVVHDQPLLDHGELGAATMPILAAIVCTRWQLGDGAGPLALIAAHSDGSERGVYLLREYGT